MGVVQTMCMVFSMLCVKAVIVSVSLQFFSCFAIAMLAMCAELIWVIMAIVFFQTKGTTMLFAGGMFGMAGLMFFVCGIVLSVITQKHKKLYEVWLTQFYEHQKK